MPGPDRERGVLTTDDRDYLSDRKDLQPDSERNARKRIRDRVRNSLYDFDYLITDFEDRDVTQLVANAEGTNEQIFDAAEDVIAFLFRMCAHAPETPGHSTNDRFREMLRNGIEKGLEDDDELLDFRLDLQYGVPHERKLHILGKVQRGEQLTLAELREVIENDYLDDSLSFRPLGEHDLPKNVDVEDTLSADDYR